MDKLLIYEDNGQKQTFRLACETTAAQANDLINVFESYQDLAEIKTIDQFAALVSDPIAYYDEVLRSGLNLQTTGNRTPDPSVLSSLFGYDRPNYINTIQSLPLKSAKATRQKLSVKRRLQSHRHGGHTKII